MMKTKKLKSKWNYRLSVILGMLILTSCNTEESSLPIVTQETTIDTIKKDIPPTKVVETTPPISLEIVRTIEAIKNIYGADISLLVEDYLSKTNVKTENEFITFYKELINLKTTLNKKKSVNFDKYYNSLVNDTLINNQILPINFACIEECTNPFIGINTKQLMTIALKSNSKKAIAFTEAITYAYPRIENDYVGFMEYCDECFGATSNIGDYRIYKYLKLNQPFLNDKTILGNRLNEIAKNSIQLAIGEQYRYNAEKVTLELNKWIDEDLIPQSQKELVINKLEEIKNESEKNKFNYESESYPEMHN